MSGGGNRGEGRRVFVALDPPVEVRAEAEAWARHIAQSTTGLRVVPARNSHVTLAFLGQRDESEIERIARAFHGQRDESEIERIVRDFLGQRDESEIARIARAFHGQRDESEIARIARAFHGQRDESEIERIARAFHGQRDESEIERIVRDAGQVVGPGDREHPAEGAGTGAVGGLSLGAPAWLPKRRPRSLVLDLHDDRGELAGLQARLARLLRETLAWKEPRPYRPHLTCARTGRGFDPSRLRLPVSPAIDFSGESVTLYASHLSPEGAEYEVIERFPVDR